MKIKKVLLLSFLTAVLLPCILNAATITVPNGSTVTISSSWVGDEYIVYGTLQATGDLQMGAALTIKNGGKVNVANNFSAYGQAIIIETGGELNAGSLQVQGSAAKPFSVMGKVNVTGVATINGFLFLETGGKFNVLDINFSNPNNSIKGIVTASGNVTFNNVPNTMECPGQIITQNFYNYSSSNPITGSGYIEVNGTFDSNNSLTSSSAIYLNVAGGVPVGENKGSATLGNKSSACDGKLPVTFGIVMASINNNILSINWTTLRETNNDHFNIEASEDGMKFIKIGSIETKATNGNSDQVLNYQYQLSLTDGNLQAIAGSILLSFFVGGFMFFSKKRKNSLLMPAAMFMCFSMILIACNKNNDIEIKDSNKNILVRISQIDKNGDFKYSEIVKVTLD